ncbi:MAG: DNA gyrase C-terminal beta-propeller domain-containing protein, partial [bacterium]
RIVITEIPYMVNKSDIITRVADLVRDKRLDGIYDIRDETDRKGIRVVIELDGDRSAEYVLHQLFRLTPLESTINVGFLALVEGVPRLLTLREMLNIFLEHRRNVITRRTQFDLRKAREREHILLGLTTALSHIDEVIAIIKKSESPEVAREKLMTKFKLTEIQSRAILDMRLQTLTGLEISKIKAELQEIKKTIADLEEILAKPERLRSVIRGELKEILQKYGDERRTTFEDPQDVDLSQLIHKEQVVVTITKKGYIKRVPLDAYRTYNKGAKGLIGLELTGEDAVHGVAVGWTTEPLFIFTKGGKIFRIDTHEIYDADRYGRGRPITNLVDNLSGDHIAFIKAPEEARKTVILITRNGKAKRINADELQSIRRNGKIVAKMKDADELLEAFWVNENDKIFIVTFKGRGILFSISQIREMGRGAKGVRAIRLNPGDAVAGATVVRGKQELLFLTGRGYAKRLAAEELRTYEHRGGKGVIVYRIKDLTGDMIGVHTVVEQIEMVSLTSSGKVVRQLIEGISEQSRYARGVRAVTLDEGDKIETFGLL